jgi:hypothetical protein
MRASAKAGYRHTIDRYAFFHSALGVPHPVCRGRGGRGGRAAGRQTGPVSAWPDGSPARPVPGAGVSAAEHRGLRPKSTLVTDEASRAQGEVPVVDVHGHVSGSWARLRRSHRSSRRSTP